MCSARYKHLYWSLNVKDSVKPFQSSCPIATEEIFIPHIIPHVAFELSTAAA